MEDKRKYLAPHLGTIVEYLFPNSLNDLREMSGDKANKKNRSLPIIPRVVKKKKVVIESSTLAK